MGDTHPWDNLSLPSPPLGYLRFDLVPKLGFDLISVPREEREETLRPTVYDVDLVQRDSADDLFAFWTPPSGHCTNKRIDVRQ